LSLALGAWAIPAGATTVTIVNAGFESPSLGPSGVQQVTPTGWTPLQGNSGTWDLTGWGAYWNSGAPEGTQVVYLPDAPRINNQQATIGQILAASLLSDTTYTLSGWVGNPKGYGTTPPATVYTAALYANGSLLQSISGTPAVEGTFELFSLTFDSSTQPGLVGQQLEIRLSSNQAQTAFDSISLNADADATGRTAAAVPEPATLSLLGLGLLAVSARRLRARI
jgi:hypothetical protein